MNCINSEMYADPLAPWVLGTMLGLCVLIVGIGIRILARGRWVISVDGSLVLTGRRLWLVWSLVILAVCVSGCWVGFELNCLASFGRR